MIQPMRETDSRLFQTPACNSCGWRKTLGEFYAGKMAAELSFEYILLDKGSATDVDVAFDEASGAIEPRIRRVFVVELA